MYNYREEEVGQRKVGGRGAKKKKIFLKTGESIGKWWEAVWMRKWIRVVLSVPRY